MCLEEKESYSIINLIMMKVSFIMVQNHNKGTTNFNLEIRANKQNISFAF
jgi:hypothetical protein